MQVKKHTLAPCLQQFEDHLKHKSCSFLCPLVKRSFESTVDSIAACNGYFLLSTQHGTRVQGRRGVKIIEAGRCSQCACQLCVQYFQSHCIGLLQASINCWHSTLHISSSVTHCHSSRRRFIWMMRTNRTTLR